MVNEENAQFQQAELAGPQAEIKVAQKRQDLYLAGAVQYWDWQVAVKQAEIVKRALAVAEERLVQVEGLAKAGRPRRSMSSRRTKRFRGGNRLRSPRSGRWSMSSTNCPSFSGRTASR